MERILDFVVSGAGLSGVIISKYLKENAIDFLTLEKRDGIGGIWYYSDDPNITTATRNTITTSGRRITVFSDFPPHEEWTQFLKWSEMLQHIREYAEHYGILDNVELNATILRVAKTDEDLWRVEYRNRDDELEVVHARHFVVAGGAFSGKLTPLADEYSDRFEGRIYHGQQIKLNNEIRFRGQRVLVTGGGETASDIAMHAACVAEKTCWAIPDGLQSLDRCLALEYRADPGRIEEVVFDTGPSLTRNRTHTQHLSEKPHNNEYFVHSRLGANGHGVKEWLVDNYYGNKFPTKNGETIYLVHEGKITPYRSIEDISGKRVLFDNGKSEEIDLIVECTGYKKSYDYFADEAYQTVDYEKLYRNFVHIDDPSLYILGVVRPTIGSVPAFVEYQSQYVVDLFEGRVRLPSRAEMVCRIEEDRAYHVKLFEGCGRLRPDILDGFNYYPYVMASDMGRLPEDHLSGLSEEQRDVVLHTSFNAGLFLWVGDERKQAKFIESAAVPPMTVRFRRLLTRASVKGVKRDPLFRKLDERVFKKKNAANLLFYGKGLLHRKYLLRKKIPILLRLLGERNCGPFPLNHPYFTYQVIDAYSTNLLEKIAIFGLFAGVFLALSVVGNWGLQPTTFLLSVAFLAGLFLSKLRRRRALVALGVLQALASLFLMQGQVTLEMLLAPVVYGTLIHRVVRTRRSIPVLRKEVEGML